MSLIVESSFSLRWQRRIAALRTVLERWPWLLPLCSFALGWIGFLMVRRGAELARIVALLAVLSWLWLLLAPLVRRLLIGRLNTALGNLVTNFVTQSIQQELLFFALPFLVGAAQRDVGQIAFIALTAAAALLSTVDPLFERYIARNAATRLAFHAYCSWIAALVALPIVLRVPLERALPLASALSGVWLLLTLPAALASLRTRRRKLAWLAALLLAPLLLWLSRAHVPPAGLSVTSATISHSIDNLTPGPPLRSVTVAELSQGVVAFVAIRAPMGVAQSVIFEWRHGDERERIAAEIRGGSKQGWRTFSRKQIFPQHAEGRWTVDVLTPQGQLLKRMQFKVEADSHAAVPPPAQ